MNAQIAKLFAFVLVLFGLLVVFTSRWTVFDATALNHNPLNSRETILAQKIKRGRILADDGAVLARSLRQRNGNYTRTYPFSSEYVQSVGYWTGQTGNAAGLEVSRNDALEGRRSGISSVFGPLNGNSRVGDDVVTTLDPKAQAAARTGLAGRVGAVVALQPQTGAILAMYANPIYDANHPNRPCPSSCQLDRATQAAYPPGSTFKVVTASAAIDSGKYSPTSSVDGSSPATISGVPLSNDAGDPPLGTISFTYALTQSINTAFARVAVSLGTDTMTTYMKRFGFYAKPPLDIPPSELRASDVLSPAGKRYPAGSADEDIGRIGIGQGGLAVTPMQMAMVASAVAGNGRLMAPHLTDRIVDPDGRTVRTIKPQLYHRVMSPATAQAVNGMMRTVVDEGTGNSAQLGSGVQFAGKTGTASVGPTGSQETDPWFIGFAPADNPKVAVAVALEKTDNEYGGQVAAPIARDVVQTLLSEGK